MGAKNIFDQPALVNQIELQKRHAWDAESDISWNLGIDLSKPFLPMDKKNLMFPGVSQEQQVVLSQFFGLVVNETISEMECSLPQLKYLGWEKQLKKFSVCPEMWELGELFFLEESKHASTFIRFRHQFCHQMGIEPEVLNTFMPKAFGSQFLNRIVENAKGGGHAFWWVVAAVEEVSIEVFKAIHRNKKACDPLYYELHKRHAEEEARHENYAFLMLDVVKQSAQTIRARWHLKSDLLLAQVVPGPWVVTELSKIYRSKDFANKNEFFKILSTCLPYFEKLSRLEVIRYFMNQTPYVSWLINPTYCRKLGATQQNLGAWKLPNLPLLKVEHDKI